MMRPFGDKSVPQQRTAAAAVFDVHLVKPLRADALSKIKELLSLRTSGDGGSSSRSSAPSGDGGDSSSGGGLVVKL